MQCRGTGPSALARRAFSILRVQILVLGKDLGHPWAFLSPLGEFLGVWLVWEGQEGWVLLAETPLFPIGLGATRLSPQMAMLLKLQEAANYIESPDRETMVDPDLQSTL